MAKGGKTEKEAQAEKAAKIAERDAKRAERLAQRQTENRKLSLGYSVRFSPADGERIKAHCLKNGEPVAKWMQDLVLSALK